MLFRMQQPLKHPIYIPAEMWRDYIRNINVVDATQEGRPNDHQYKHESIEKKREKNILSCSLKTIV